MTTILLVEDDPALRRALRTMMRSRDLDVLDVATGEEAVVVASSGTPDLLVLDLGLPDIDGLEVLRRVRAFSKLRFATRTVVTPRARRWTRASRAASPAPTSRTARDERSEKTFWTKSTATDETETHAGLIIPTSSELRPPYSRATCHRMRRLRRNRLKIRWSRRRRISQASTRCSRARPLSATTSR